MKDLETNGYLKNLYPFTDEELKFFEQTTEKVKDLELEDRKNVFSQEPKLRDLIEQKLKQIAPNYGTSNYCFYLEKNAKQNWPLALHQDLNFPSYLEETSKNIRETGCWFRINLDSSDRFTGALKVIPQSHQNHNKVEPIFLDNSAGEVILFKPLLFHGSNKMTIDHRRRVFQVLCQLK